MACRDSGGSKILLCLGLYLVASSFCHCTRLTKLKALDKLRENSTLSQGRAKGSELRHGRLLIGQNSLQGAKVEGTKAAKSLLDVDTDYQADMGWGEPRQPNGQSDGFSRLKPDNAAVARLLKMEPKVECTGDSMKLQVQDDASTPGSLFFVDRGSRQSPLPLSELPPSCGYTIRSTRRDLVLVAPYDGCFVALEEDSYVLPLRWWGLAVRMSCPLMRQSSPNPPMVTCHAEGMVVKTEWTVSVANIKVKLTGSWEPLMKASPRCGFSVIVHPEGVVISVRYAPCLEKKDEMYTLELAGEGETKISCPPLSPAQPGPTKGPKQQTETPSKGVYPSIPSHNSASTRAPETIPQNPAPSAVPQVPGFPQNPEVPNRGPKDIYQPQLPYFPYPNFFYPNPANPDTKPTPTVQATPPPITKRNYGQQSQQTVPPAKLPLNPEGQVPQPLIPLPFYPWLAQPEVEEPPIQPPATQQPNGQEKQPFYPYPFYVRPPNTDGVPPAPRPELKPLPSTAPPVVKTTKDQRQQPVYHFPFYPQPPKPETLPKEPPVIKPPPGKLEKPFLPNPFNQPSQPLQKPVEQSASQPEGQEHKPLYPLPFYPWPPVSEAPQVEPPYPLYPVNPKKPLPEQPVPPKPPVSEEPQGQIYLPFYPYSSISPPFLPQGPYQPVPPTQPTPTPAPKDQVQQPLSPLQPEASKPKVPENVSSKPPPAPESKEPPQPEAPQGQVYQSVYPYALYPQPKPENQPAEKPIAVAKPPQPEFPQGQVYQSFYPYPFYPQPEPENQPAVKPAAVPKPPQPPQPEAPQGQVYQSVYPYALYPQPKPENQPAEKPIAVAKPPQPEFPQGQVYQSFYPYPFYPQPEPENQPAVKPAAVPKPPQPPQPEAPQGQIYQSFYPQPEPENQPAEKPTAVPKPPQPPQPEAPQGQVYQSFYPYPYYFQPEPENQPAVKPTAVPKPPQPEAPQGQVYQSFYPYPFYPQPEPESQPAEKPTAVPKPPATETPKGQVQKPSYPHTSKIPGAGTNGDKAPTEKPVQSKQPPAVKPPEGQVPHPFNPYYYPQHVTLPSATSMPQQQVTIPARGQTPGESAIPQPTNGGKVPQGPQLGSSFLPPVYCPQFCPSGFSNCCPQIAFHQHLHHIVPAGNKDAPPAHPGLPFLPSAAYSGFGSDFVSVPLPQKQTEAATAQAATTSTSAPTSSQSLPSGNEKQPYLQPPDGNPAALPGSNPSKPTNPEQLIYPYFVPNSLYPNWPYPPQKLLQNLPQRLSPAHYSVPSEPQAPGNEAVNPVVQYEPSNVQPPMQQYGQLSTGDMNNPSGPALLALVNQYAQQYRTKQQNKPTAKELQPSNEKYSESKGLTHPKAQNELDRLLVPYYMLQDAQAPTYNKLVVSNNSQPQQFVSGSKKSTRHEQTASAYSEPKSYVLLQHGPPGREPNSFNESPLPFRNQHQSSEPQHPQNLKALQEKPQHPKWLEKGMSNPLPGNINYMPRPGDKSGLPLLLSAPDGPHFVPLPQDPSPSAAHLKPKFLQSFKDLWKPVTPLGSSQSVPPHVPGNAFQQWSSAADQANGLHRRIQRESGNWNQK